MKTCPGSGKTYKHLVCKADPGVRDLSSGRGVCTACGRTVGLTVKGNIRTHGSKHLNELPLVTVYLTREEAKMLSSVMSVMAHVQGALLVRDKLVEALDESR